MDIRNVFSKRHVVLPVIHVAGREQALRNALIAREAGVDGLFLINHQMSATRLLSIHRAVVAEHDDWWVGVNCLDLSPVELFQRIDNTVAGVWVDNAMIDENAELQTEAERIVDVRHESGWSGLYFGGVAFKYQRPVDDLRRAAEIAAPYMDVVTTSGPGTGHAALPEKIKVMKQAIGQHPLAIASGITPENVTDYLQNVDCFLVATGISKSFEDLDPDRVNALVRKIRKGADYQAR